MAKKTGSSRGSSRQRQEHTQPVAGRVTRARSQTPQPVHDASDSERPRKKSRTTQNERKDLPPVDEDEHEDHEEAEVASLAEPPNTAQSVRSGTSRYTVITAHSQEELRVIDAQSMLDGLEEFTHAADQVTGLLLPKDRIHHAILRRELRNEASSDSKKLKRRVKTLKNLREDFGTTDYVELDIVLRGLLGVTNVEDISGGAWRPDPILYRVNIAQMLLVVCTAEVDDLEEVDGPSKEALENLATYFPASIAGEAPSQGAFSLQLHLLLQLCILNLAMCSSKPTKNPHSIISEILFDTDPDQPGRFRYYNKLNLSKLGPESQTKYTNTFIATVEHIKSTIGTEDDQVTPLDAARKLRAQYPWDSFVQRVGKYCNDRIRELDGHIQLAGGMESIQENLKTEVNRRLYARAADEKRQSLGRASGSHKKLLGSAAELKQRAMRQTQSSAGSAVATPNAASAGAGRVVESDRPATASAVADVEDDWVPPPDDDYYNGNDADLAEAADDGPQDDDADGDNAEASGSILKSAASGSGAAEPGSMRALLSTFGDQGQRQNAAKGKSFVDRQQGATRVSFEDESQTQRPSNTQRAEAPRGSSSAAQTASPRPRQQPASRSPAKRTRDEMEADDDFEPTQDTGFQTDRRDIAAAADERRRAAPRQQQPGMRASASQQLEPSRVFSAFAQPAALDRGGSSRSSGSGRAPPPAPRNSSPPPAVRRNNPGSSVPTYNPHQNHPAASSAGDSRSWAELTHDASALARLRTASEAINKERRARRAWELYEDEALYKLMEEHGISWSAIKSADMSDGGGNVLVSRTAEDIRFRARNNKFKFLKSGYTMDRLPPGLAQVPLQKSQIDQLLRMGVDVQQDRIRALPDR